MFYSRDEFGSELFQKHDRIDRVVTLATRIAEVLFEAARPVLLNGIEDVIIRPDLRDRAIFLSLAPMPDVNRRPAELWRKFEIVRPTYPRRPP